MSHYEGGFVSHRSLKGVCVASLSLSHRSLKGVCRMCVACGCVASHYEGVLCL